jgi:hypothetical protein
MHHSKILIGVASAALALCIAVSASAQTKPVKKAHRAYRPVVYTEQPALTVNRRSFLDPGPVAPVGSRSNYVADQTIFNRTPDQVFARSKFGNEALPRPLEVPGRPSPLFEFETPGYPY